MIGLFIFAAAQSSQPLTMPNDYRGRWSCRLSTWHSEPSSLDLWIYNGKASTPGDEASRLMAVRDASVLEGPAKSSNGATVTALEFKAGDASVLAKLYKRTKSPGVLYLTVRRDATDDWQVQHETASGFCSPVVPNVAPRKNQP